MLEVLREAPPREPACNVGGHYGGWNVEESEPRTDIGEGIAGNDIGT
jgi:hypothetical protein